MVQHADFRARRRNRRTKGGGRRVWAGDEAAEDGAARVWCDGSFDTRNGGAAWGAVITLPDGETLDASGWLGFGRTSADAEVLAAAYALAALPEGLPVVIYTDCRAIATRERERWGSAPRIAAWGRLEQEISSRPGRVTIVWRRRNSSCQIVAAHHLANAARLLGALGRRMAERVARRIRGPGEDVLPQGV